MLQEGGTTSGLVGEERGQFRIQLSVAPAAVGSWEVGRAPSGISLLDAECPSPHWLIHNPAAPASRS